MFAGALLPNFLPESVAMLTPWNLSRVAVGLAQGVTMPASWPTPIIATALWAALFVAVALWRFAREEF